MPTDIALRVIPNGTQMRVGELTAQHLGLLAAVQTDAALYFGTIYSLAFYASGSVYIGFEHGESDSKAQVTRDALILVEVTA